MAKILDLSVRGVRSFGQQEEQKLSFQTPLTLILGQNGCGKTTLIEALKFATTGEYPPNSDMGKSFIHDPKIEKTTVTRSCVKLRFQDLRGWRLEVNRMMELTQKHTKMQLQTKDTSIRRTDPSGVHPTKMTTSKCIDANDEIERSLGVPKAVLTDVMFCHQEDSNWPLDEPKKVKEKFDRIFSAERYIKCLEKIRSVRKEQMEKMKHAAKDRQFFQENKDVARGKRIELATRDAELKKLMDDIDEFDKTCAQLENQLTELHKKEKEMENARVKMERCKTTLEQIAKNQADLKKNIREEFQGTKEELEAELANFPQKVAAEEEKLKQLEKSLKKLESEVKSLNARRDADQKQLGQLENEEKRQEERKKNRLAEAYKLQSDFNLEKADTGTDEIQFILEKLEETIKNEEEDIDCLASVFEAKVQECAKMMSSFGEQRSGIQTEIRLKRDAIVKCDTDMKTMAKERDSILVSDTEQARIKKDIETVESDIKTEEESYDREAMDKQYKELSHLHSSKAAALKELRKEHTNLVENQALLKKREETDEEIKAKEEKIDHLKAQEGANLTKILDDYSQLSVSDMQDAVDEKRRKYDSEARKKNEELKKIRSELGMAQGKISHFEDRLQKIDSEIQAATSKIRREVGVSKTVKSVLEENEKDISETIEKIAEKTAFQRLATKFKSSMEQKDKPFCVLCQRSFQNEEERITAVAGIEKSIKGEDVKELEEKLEECRTLAAKLAPLSTLEAKKMTLEEEDKPRLKQELEKLTEETGRLEKEVKEKEKEVDTAQGLLETCRSLITHVQTMAERTIEIRTLRSKLQALDKKLNLTQLSHVSVTDTQRSITQMKDSLDELEAEVEKLEVDLRKSREKSTQKMQRLMQLRESKVQLEKELMDFIQAADRRRKLEENIEQLKKSKEDLKVELAEKEKELGPVQEKERAAQQEKENEEKKMKEGLDKARREMDALNQRKQNFVRMCDEIEKYEKSGISKRFKDVQDRLVAHGRDLDSKKREEEELREKQKEVQSGVVEQKLRLQDLKSCMVLFNNKETMQREEEALEKHTKDYENFNPTQLMQEKSRLNSRWSDAENAKHKKKGAEGELRKDITARKRELEEPRLKNAAKDYAKALFRYKCLDAIVKDMNKYYMVLDKAIMKYHEDKMGVINRILRELWHETYKGNDIDYVRIATEQSEKLATAGADSRRTYNYRVVMRKSGTELDMRGRCSAGQKILACLIIRVALAETFGTNCGILALDEPTTNLDKENVQALVNALLKIVENRRQQRNFQLVVITHDESFIRVMLQQEKIPSFYRVSRNREGYSRIDEEDAAMLLA